MPMIRAAATQFRWSNLLTYAGVSAAMLGIVLTEGPATRFWGGAGIALAVGLDLFDGRFAGLFSRTEEEQRIGVEIDSLADVIAFGLAPAVCVVRATVAATTAERAVLLAAGIGYLVCILTRLAHFNVFQAGTGRFIGLPSSIAGLMCAVFLLFEPPNASIAAAVLAVSGVACVSALRIRRPGKLVLYSLLATCIAVALAHLRRLVVA
jgi:CDP-diacylglycerol---serine O-phosphatidyltransferase